MTSGQANQFLVQLHYGEAGPHVLECDLARYLAVLLRVAGVHEVSVAERNVAAATAYLLADEEARQRAFAFAGEEPDWEELLRPLAGSAVSLCLFRDCCQVAWADGDLDPAESALLHQVALWLGLAGAARDQLLDAVRQQESARLLSLQWFGSGPANA